MEWLHRLSDREATHLSHRIDRNCFGKHWLCSAFSCHIQAGDSLSGATVMGTSVAPQQSEIALVETDAQEVFVSGRARVESIGPNVRFVLFGIICSSVGSISM
jgi:hypothetical protein